MLWKALKAAPVFVLAVLLTILFGRTGLLRQLETTALDTQLRLRRVNEKNPDIVVVQITDADYRDRTLFNGKSPLDPAALKRVLVAIANGQPKVIGVDIDTSSPEFHDLRPEPGWPPVV